ncbi:MAG: hypothetical protein LBE34_09300 [Flavobacteriaceae bacterium]|jgi:hypothetical protein|nr:hypothetical protein [Flavobacteriaceae bacterium]
MKKVIFFALCVFISIQVQAQKSVRISYDLKPGMSFDISKTSKETTVINLTGDEKMINQAKKEGAQFPSTEIEELKEQYTINWKEGINKNLNFSLDLVKNEEKKLKDKKLLSTNSEKASIDVAFGVLDERTGLKINRIINQNFKPFSSEVEKMLINLFREDAKNVKLTKVNDATISEDSREMEFSKDSKVDLTTKEEFKLVKIENGKAYLTKTSIITSVSTAKKYAELNSKGLIEMIYNIEQKYIESIEGTVNVLIKHGIDGNIIINTAIENYHKIVSKKK